MNNLTTRKIVLGALLAFVFAFSVQGIADALTLTRRTSDDLKYRYAGQTFNISFSVSGVEDSNTVDVDWENGEVTLTRIANTDVSIDNSSTFTLKQTLGAGDADYLQLRNGTYNLTFSLATDITPDIILLEVSSDDTAGSSLPYDIYAVAIAQSDDDPTDWFDFELVDPPFIRGLTGVPGVDDIHHTAVVNSLATLTNIDNNFAQVKPAGVGHLITYEVTGGGRLYIFSEDRNRKSTSSARLTTSTDAEVWLDMNGATNILTARIPQANTPVSDFVSDTATVIFGYARVNKVSGDDPIQIGNAGVMGSTGARLADPFVVQVVDSNGRAVANEVVEFEMPNNGSMGDYDEAKLVRDPSVSNDRLFDGTDYGDGPVQILTDSNGRASVFLRLGDEARNYMVFVNYAGDRVKTFTATAVAQPTTPAIIEIVSGDGQQADQYGVIADPLVVRVLDSRGRIHVGAEIDFLAIDGGMLTHSDGTTTPGLTTDTAGGNGEAFVRYTPPVGVSGTRRVRASINDGLQSVTFTVNGTPGQTPDPGDDDDDDDDDSDPTVSITPASLSGEAGSTQSLVINAGAQNTDVALGNPDFTIAGGDITPASSNTGNATSVTISVTLPTAAGSYILSARIGSVNRAIPITVTAPTTPDPGRLAITTDFDGVPGATSTVTVRATQADGEPAADVAVTLGITNGGGTLSPASVTTNSSGVATSTLTRGSAAGNNYFITATATNYSTAQSRISITGGSASAFTAYDGNNQSGALNTPLPEPFIVEVVDSNGAPVANVNVRFRTTIGTGRFSPAIANTNAQGLAQTTFTPTSAGRIRAVATIADVSGTAAFIVFAGEEAETLVKVSGDSQRGTPGNALAGPFVVEVQDADGDPVQGIRVTFTVTAGDGSLSETSATSNAAGRAQTRLTLGSQPGVNSVRASATGVDPVTFSTSIEPEVLIGAGNRPSMYWIDGGVLYHLDGDDTHQIAEDVNGVVIAGDQLYWTATTGSSAGTINRADLDGSGAAVLASIMSVPMGIAVDTAGGKLYWTNARGRVQSANLNGSGIRNLVQNLSDPTDLLLNNGHLYWVENGDTIRRANLSGQRVIRDVASGLGVVGGIAIGNGKLYWTEQTGPSAGTINRADLDGTNFQTLASIRSVPVGISVDTAGSKLYWTNARGRVQRGTLSAGMITNVIEGLIAPGTMLVGGASGDDGGNGTTPAPTPDPPADRSIYDVNNDGVVDNVDASLVAAAVNTVNDDYDVNEDGIVNFLDILLVFDNRDSEAAGAPTIVGMQLTAVQVDNIREQIDLLVATNDRSPAALRTLVYLQQLLATARPSQTQLLTNYPNPFNPETWIPYTLATDTAVRITIYNTQGVVVRSLLLGHQTAGYYMERDRAAYWDGRNAMGERVASGIYFYQLETDTMSAMRKMVILK